MAADDAGTAVRNQTGLFARLIKRASAGRRLFFMLFKKGDSTVPVGHLHSFMHTIALLGEK
jgi:hypothetical protein